MFVNGIHVEEYAKLEYGRLLWRVPAYRERLLATGTTRAIRTAGRFAEREAEVTRILESPKDSDAALDSELRRRNSSLRAVVKEIPSVFGSFFWIRASGKPRRVGLIHLAGALQ